MGLSRTVSEINGDFGRKSQILPTHAHLSPPLREFLWNFVTMVGLKKTEQLRQQSTEVRHYGTAPPASHSYTAEISPSRQQMWPQMLSIHVSILALVIAASGPLARGYPTYY